MSVAAVAPKKPTAPRTLRYRFRKAWRAILFVGLVPFFVPSLVTSFVPVPVEIVTFLSGVLVLVPLSTFIEVVTEDLIERLGQLIGGLLHAFFGNIAYFVLTASALITAAGAGESSKKSADLITIVQSSIAGTIVIDILFILGVSIFIGSMRNGRMQFSAEYSNQYAEMLTIAVIALALPTLAQKVTVTLGLTQKANPISPPDVVILSNVTAIILLVAYLGYLGWTVFHFRDIPAKVENPDEADAAVQGNEYGPFAVQAADDEDARQRQQYADLQASETLRRNEPAPISPPAVPQNPSAMAAVINERLRQQTEGKVSASVQAEEDRQRGIALWELAILVAGAGGVVFISENMAHVFENSAILTTQLHLNPFFIGFILLPVASNLVELSAAVSTSWHNRMETCLAITAGSAIQVALLIAPLLILVAHIIGLTSMTLTFGYFVLAIFALIAYLFQIATVDGETTWLEGLQFTSFFAVVVVVALLAG